MTPTFEQQLCLLPIRLELRRVQGTVAKAKLTPGPGGTSGPTTIVYSNENFGAPQYWIRWYPDETELLAPIRGATAEEAAAFNEIQRVYDGEFGRGRVQDRTDQFTQAAADGDS